MKPQPNPADLLAGAVPKERKSPRQAFQLQSTVFSTMWFAPALAALLVSGIGLWLASALNIWIDEAYTIHSTERGLSYAVDQSIKFELQPPFYFILVAAWRVIDESSVTFARLPSIAFAAAAAAVIVVTARRVAPNVPSIAVAFATALNPIVIWAAVEMRVYSLVLLVAASLTLTFVDGFLAPVPSRIARSLYALFGIIGLYTQFYIGFILVAFGITLLVRKRGSLRAFLITNAVIALAFLPFAPIALKQIHDTEGGDVRHVSAWRAIHEVFNANFVYVLPHEIAWTGKLKIVGFSVAGIIVGSLAVFGRPLLNAAGGATMLTCVAASTIFSLVFIVVGEAPDVRRHAIAIAPLAILSALAVISALSLNRRTLLIGAALSYTLFAGGNLWQTYQPPTAKGGDWKRVATQVTNSVASVPVVIFPSNLALALGRYLPKQTQLVAFPQPMTFTPNYLDSMKLKNEAQVAIAFKTAGLATAEFWLVSDNSCDPGPHLYDFSCQFLKSYISRHFRLRRQYFYRGATAMLFEPT